MHSARGEVSTVSQENMRREKYNQIKASSMGDEVANKQGWSASSLVVD
jgi:hypothetical protein